MKVGLPRALLYYYYNPFWEAFFKELGIDVVISNETNKKIINQGIKESVPEICVPIKIFIGHVIDLTEKDVDYIFIPRMISIYKEELFCPKFLGLPDMLIHGLKGIENKVLTCHIESDCDDISDYRNYLCLREKLGVSIQAIKRASDIAKKRWMKFRKYNKMGYTANESLQILEDSIIPKNEIDKKIKNNKKRVKILVLGYVYNLYDSFLNMNIMDKLRSLDVEFLTFEMLDEEEIRHPIENMEKVLFWTFTNKLLGVGYKYFRNKEVDGIIHLTAFGCGPDSFLGKLLELESDATGIPFMTIRLDEHTGENHLQTRIEAFIDMIRRKKLKVI